MHIVLTAGAMLALLAISLFAKDPTEWKQGEVNAPVQYAADKDHLYIKDSDGKSHKLTLIRTTRKE